MSIKVKIFLIIFSIFLIRPAFSMTEEELKEYTYIDFYNFISSYNFNIRNVVNGFYGNKKMDIGKESITTYLQPAEKYITYLEYRGASRSIDLYKQPFLLDWFKISNNTKEFNSDDSAESILADQNFGLFYTSTMYSTRGKTYFIITQKAINDAMVRELKLGEQIKIYLWNLGQYSNNIPVFVIVGFEKVPTITQAVKEEIYFKEYFPVLKNDIFNRRYDKAKGNIEMLLKKYPNNLDLKLNLCLIFNETNFFDKSISCYKEILKVDSKNYDAYYGISTAYYNNTKLNNKARSNLIIESTSKALEIIQSLTARPTGSLAIITFNCYYLRAMAKVELKDITAIDDLMTVYKNQPTLVSSESIEYFKKLLGIK